MTKSVLTAVLTAVTVSACAAEPPPIDKARAEMSQRERDSTIAASRLPGSGVVRKGMKIADREAKRAAMLDSIGTEN